MFVAPIVDLGAEIKMAALQFLCYGLPLSLITVFSEHASNKSYRHGGTSAMNTHSHIHTVHTVYIYHCKYICLFYITHCTAVY